MKRMRNNCALVFVLAAIAGGTASAQDPTPAQPVQYVEATNFVSKDYFKTRVLRFNADESEAGYVLHFGPTKQTLADSKSNPTYGAVNLQIIDGTSQPQNDKARFATTVATEGWAMSIRRPRFPPIRTTRVSLGEDSTKVATRTATITFDDENRSPRDARTVRLQGQDHPATDVMCDCCPPKEACTQLTEPANYRLGNDPANIVIMLPNQRVQIDDEWNTVDVVIVLHAAEQGGNIVFTACDKKGDSINNKKTSVGSYHVAMLKVVDDNSADWIGQARAYTDAASANAILPGLGTFLDCVQARTCISSYPTASGGGGSQTGSDNPDEPDQIQP
ncbi:MAG: hypothetical protein JNK25_07565 [Phycisphaerae bacterium]|nr:hypothetical protein [Phycisphaerae bacterium]